MPATPTNIVLLTVESCLLLAGLVLLWRLVLRPAGRTPSHLPAALAPWNVSVTDFLLFLFVVISGGVLAHFATGLLLGSFPVSTDTKTIFTSAGFQLGLLTSAVLLPLQLGHRTIAAPFVRGALSSGLVTFLIALPVVSAMNYAWLWVLQLCGLPAEQQDLLRLFTQTDSVGLLAIMIALATLVAPVAEELVFRATLFRYLRTRLPRWIALLLPGIFFAALHVNWATLDGLASFAPLVTLALVFSLAYERTGRIGTAMVAHALFNLHTIILLFSGILS